MIQEDTQFSVTESYLKSIGVDTSSKSNIRQALYLMGGDYNNISVSHNAYVRVADRPYMVFEDTLYVAKRRDNSLIKNFCKSGQTLNVKLADVPAHKEIKFVTDLPYQENYAEASKLKAQVKEYMIKHKYKGKKFQKSHKSLKS